MRQEYSSKETSINVVNKVYKQYDFKPNTKVLDYGGGKYDTNKEYMYRKHVDILVYDKYNREESHNNKVLSLYPYDYIVCSNVLNVIKEDLVIDEILRHMLNLGTETTIYLFAVYEGNKSGIGTVTKKGYQRNQRLDFYNALLKGYFKTVEKRKGLLICKKC